MVHRVVTAEGAARSDLAVNHQRRHDVRRGRAQIHHIDFDHAHLVASAFLEAPRASADALVRAAYSSLGDQADLWFARITGTSTRAPVRVVHTRCPEPYATARELSDHVHAERVLEICPARYDRDRRHPLLDILIGGTYDRLRAVHDIVSHAWKGYGFDRDGEFSAWLTEDRMYTGLARWALASELHAEHSVRWTTGELAEHKAVLLHPTLLAASRRRAATPTDPTHTESRST
jgi:hypothetical protein